MTCKKYRNPSFPETPSWLDAHCRYCCICVFCGPCTIPSCLKRCPHFVKSMYRYLTSLEARKRSKAQRKAKKPTPQSDLVVLGAWPEDPRSPPWPSKRERPITPPPDALAGSAHEEWKTIPQAGAFFTKLPLEIRRKVYDFALGEAMLRLEVDGAELDVWHCNGWTKSFWAENGGWKKYNDYGWKHPNYPPEEHKKGRKRRQRKAAINLLCTCRQV